MFQSNVGMIDRSIRILVGAALIAMVFIGPQTTWGYLGIIPLATGFFGFCPAYCPLGLSTCRVRN